MITEDYCSFEVAKLLKEKGFNWDCITYYVDSEPDDVKYSMLFENNTTWEKCCCSAPTHQMACKWLREEKKLVISIDLNYSDNSYSYLIDSLTEHRIIGNGLEETYEEAVEAAIKYCLENLI